MDVSNGGNYSKHIYMGSQRIVSKLNNSGGFYFYHPDHLGSSSLITDGTGALTQHIQYVPFGEVFVEERTNSRSTPYKFNGKELDEETGLYYYHARYYDPRLSVWLSVDPLAEKYPNVGSYVYCMSNPVIYIDPDGRDGWTRVWGAVRFLGGAAQCVAGVGLLGVPEPTGLTKVGGVAALMHGSDDLQAGFRQLFTGKDVQSVTHTAIKSASTSLGANENNANLIAEAGDVILSFAGGGSSSFKIANSLLKSSNNFKVASEFGFKSYKALRADVIAKYGKGSGFQVHHLIEQRFANIFNQKADDMMSMVLTKTEHEAFTKAWQSIIGRDGTSLTALTTSTATKQDIINAAKEVYKNYPEILKALGIN